MKLNQLFKLFKLFKLKKVTTHLSKALLFTFLMIHTPPFHRAFAEGSTIDFYSRFNTNNNGTQTETLNGLYNFGLSDTFKMQAGMRIGETQQNLAQLNYKVELQTKRFFDYLSFFSRFTKANTLYPENSKTLKTIFMNQARLAYRLGSFTLEGSLGATFTVSSSNGSLGAPSFSGSTDWTPNFLIGTRFKNEDLLQAYILKFSNYDVFDAYPTNEPYVQLELEQEFKGFTSYIYGRYRYQDKFSDLYSFYIALGAIIPISKIVGGGEETQPPALHQHIKEH